MRGIVLRLLLLGVVLGAGIHYFGPSMAKVAVGIGGRHLSGVEVRVEAVEFEPGPWPRPAAVARLNGLTLANPAGFDGQHLVVIRQVTLQLDLGSLASDTLRIERLVLDGVSLNLERRDSGSNVRHILERLSHRNGERSATAEPPYRFAVEALELRDGEARFVYAPERGTQGQLSVPLGRRQLPPIGVEPGAVSGTALLYLLVDRLVMTAIAQVLERP